MTIQEFSDGFDTLLNSYAEKIEFGNQNSRANVSLDEYEKSLFLTKAQEDIIVTCYNGKNYMGESFEETEEMRRYLAPLVKDATPNMITNSSGLPLKMSSKSQFFTLPEDLWFITYESVKVDKGEDCDAYSNLDVYPVTQDEYHKIKRNPFRGTNSRRALRLDLSDNIVEIISSLDIENYYIRYIRRPNPIILTDLSDTGGLSINNKTEESECELHEALHQKILERAVGMALQTKGINLLKNRDS